jgi:hypothetical protein
MTTSNHLFAGAAIALVVRQPVLAIPLAYLSHFVLDALPHHGRLNELTLGEAVQHRLTWIMESVNIVGVPILVYLLWSQSWWVWVAAIAAMSPDFVWIYLHFFYERKGITPLLRRFTQFHRWIQWCERPWGIAVEMVFFVSGIALIAELV